MGAIVGGIVLFVIGAIIKYALNIELPGVESGTLGVILMCAGALLFIVGLLLSLRSRRTVVSSHRGPDGYVTERRDPPAGI